MINSKIVKYQSLAIILGITKWSWHVHCTKRMLGVWEQEMLSTWIGDKNFISLLKIYPCW